MKRSWVIMNNIIGILVIVFLGGSFPIRHYYGQNMCDIFRLIGFALLTIHLIVRTFEVKQKVWNKQE